MISCRLTLCAEAVIKDADTDSLSVFNIFDELAPSSFPFTLPKMTCLFFVGHDGKEGTVIPASLIITKGENEFFKRPIELDFRQRRTSKLVFYFHAVPFDGPGTVRVALVHEDREVGGWSFVIKDVPVGETKAKEPGGTSKTSKASRGKDGKKTRRSSHGDLSESGRS
jgi:uncharacterized protein DUF6941